MDRRSFLAGGATAAVAALAGCGAVFGSSTPEPDYDIGMTASAFRPAEFEVSVGDAVVWRNTSGRAHTVTAYGDGIPEGAPYFASGGFDSESAAREGYGNGLKGAIYPEERYEWTFEVPGAYEYFCIPHERAGMVGTVLVRE